MSPSPTYPGVYIEEVDGTAREIVGVDTSITAFIGSAPRGVENEPVEVTDFAGFTRIFGNLSADHPMGFAVNQYFQNGGHKALVIRVTNGADGVTITDAQISNPALAASRQGLWALEKAGLFNLLCIPPFSLDASGDIGAQTRSAAARYCLDRRAIFIADPLTAWEEASDLTDPVTGLDGAAWGMARNANTALYFPRISQPNPVLGGQLSEFAPCGAIAGIIARTDTRRGVWKAPAGKDAVLRSVSALALDIADADNGVLNEQGVNCLRSFPVVGRVVWGSRTLAGSNQLASEWKYLPVRRTALHIEESLFRGTYWAVFEPNDEPLWARIRLAAGAFMQGLFRQGAFQGATPKEAYFVKCDSETNSTADINNGILNLVVGFAPLRPAEFVLIKIQKTAGQTGT